MISRSILTNAVFLIAIALLVACASPVVPPSIDEILVENTTVETDETVALTVAASGSNLGFERIGGVF